MPTLFHIVPRQDGYHYLGIDDSGNHILISKREKDYRTTLLFKTEEEATAYINKSLDPNEYKAEEIWLNERFYPNIPK